jgi:hypothetical protein
MENITEKTNKKHSDSSNSEKIISSLKLTIQDLLLGNKRLKLPSTNLLIWTLMNSSQCTIKKEM